MTKLKSEQLDDVIKTSTNFIFSKYRCINNKCGWHQHLDNIEKVGIIATSQALMCIKGSINEPNRNKVIRSLNTIIIFQQEDGGWKYESNFTSESCVEPTAWALLALAEYCQENFLDNKLKIKLQASIKRGVKLILYDYNGKAWAPVNGMESRTYSTCLAVKALSKASGLDILSRTLKATTREKISLGEQYLRNIQNDDGGWGEIKGSDSRHAHSAHVVSTLIDIGNNFTDEQIVKGANYLLKNYNEDFEWENCGSKSGITELIDFPQCNCRVTYYHFTNPLVLIALIKARAINSKVNLSKIMSELVQEGIQNKGVWFHPSIPDTKTLWAIYDMLMCIKLFENANAIGLFKDSWTGLAKDKFIYVKKWIKNNYKSLIGTILLSIIASLIYEPISKRLFG
ncbi:hypothetical protein MSKOL_0167 [Methanosarcina sp. Kolksee]|uniref:prenyltransferase/squalene oxidase repeat-containing protein n=1 Tax=Methanosarcina sp. Kolksee TaxID=1434099 RepID=UPI0006154734|nr:prenyltransferase/squalene oxidase repeat-containing protein [Methanosarcina sp. Kolksee]AKB45944.1 hypothetical protein MSKOL_0167 [Methanosarcina sp. Kolksee]